MLAPWLRAHAQIDQAEAHTALRIGLVTSVRSNPYASSVERGVRLGAEEAAQTGRLFGNDVRLYETGAGSNAVAAATELLSARKVQILIAASPNDVEALTKLAEQKHILFLNVASRAQALRAACRRYTFHVDASDAMYRNAALLGRREAVATHGAVATASGGDSIALWGSTLERYGASQINDRYRAKYHVGMDDGAWAGWFAVKAVSEAALRARSSAPAQLLAYLEAPGTNFDGHKGWPLSFRLADHQLRQPLYLVSSSDASAGIQKFRDVPELRAPSSLAAVGQAARLNQALDQLISSPTAPRCQWER